MKRRNFLGVSGAGLLSAILMRDARLVQGEEQPDGLIVPKQGQVVVASSVEIQQPIGTIEISVTDVNLSADIGPQWLLDGRVTRNYGSPISVEIRGYLMRQDGSYPNFQSLLSGKAVATFQVMREVAS